MLIIYMDKIDSRESDLVIDLESGDTTSTSDHEDEIKEHLPNQGMILDRDHEVATQNEYSVLMRGEGLIIKTISKNPFISGEGVMGDDRMEKKTSLGEKKTRMGSKKPPKPPLPPGGPSLNEADIKLVKEISQLSRLRRARYERIKALKKMRADKASSSNTSNVFAMIITILFICVIIFQGILGSHV